MEYLKDFNFDLKYHPGKANVVVDALSRKALAQAMRGFVSLTLKSQRMMMVFGYTNWKPHMICGQGSYKHKVSIQNYTKEVFT
jgi:hypothetical protein